MSIGRQILLTLVLVALVPSLVLAGYAYRRTSREVGQRRDQDLLALAEQVALRIDAFVLAGLEDARCNAQLPELAGFLCASDADRAALSSQVSGVLRRVVVKDPVNIPSCALLDAQGRNLLDTEPLGVGEDESRAAHFRAAMASGLPRVSLQVEGREGEPAGVYFSSVVRDPACKTNGVLRMRVDSARLQQLVQDLRGSAEACAVLVDRNGLVLADAFHPQRRLRERAETPDLALARLGWIEGAQQGTRGRAAVVPLELMPWRLMVWMPEQSFLAPIHNLAREMAALAALVLGLLCIACWLAARRIARPIQELTRAARAIAEGTIETNIPLGPGGEVGTLSRTLGVMTGRLRSTLARLEERHRVELETQAELRAAKEAADVASAAKSQFLANMSHELRTPMTAIRGHVDLLRERTQDPALLDESLATIERSAAHLSSLVDDVLDLSRIEAGAVELVAELCSPRELALEVLAMLRPKASAKGLTLELGVGEELPVLVRTDAGRLRQILLNLLGNAVKFTAAGRVRLELAHAQELLRVRVLDSGIGIAPHEAERLFQPFSQADASMSRRFGGSGLGLSISRRLARLLGGDVELESSSPHGSVFLATVRAPACEPGPVLPAPRAEAEEGEEPRLQGRVLLVEDGRDNQRLLTLCLARAGAEVHVVENGRACLELLSRDGTPQGELGDPLPCDLILMDMQMPEMDGYTATRLLRAKGYRGPIVALTAHVVGEERRRCLDAGCDDFMSKPFDRRALVRLCARWLEQGSDARAAP